MRRMLQLIGTILLFSPVFAFGVRICMGIPHPQSLLKTIWLLRNSRMIFIYGWFPFAIGVAILCIAGFAMKPEEKPA